MNPPGKLKWKKKNEKPPTSLGRCRKKAKDFFPLQFFFWGFFVFVYTNHIYHIIPTLSSLSPRRYYRLPHIRLLVWFIHPFFMLPYRLHFVRLCIGTINFLSKIFSRCLPTPQCHLLLGKLLFFSPKPNFYMYSNKSYSSHEWLKMFI